MDIHPTNPHEADHHRTGMEEEEQQQPHGMKGMMKKVKRKAKKVKDSLTGHHEHDHDRVRDVPDDHDLDEEDDEDEDEDDEEVGDQALHGASGHEASVAAGLASGHTGRSAAAMPQEFAGGDPMKMTPSEAEQNRGSAGGGGGTGHKLADIIEEPRGPFNSPMPRGTSDQHHGDVDQKPAGSTLDAPAMTRGTADKHSVGSDRGHTLERTDQLDTCVDHRSKSKIDAPATTHGTADRHHVGSDPLGGEPTLDRSDQHHTGVDHRARPNYQSKTVDRTGLGGEEADVTPLVDSLTKTHISSGEKKTKDSDSRRNRATASVLPTGSHDQFSPEATPPVSTFDGPKHGDKLQIHDPPPQDQSSYAGKITSAVAGTAISAKNTVASKLGYGGEVNKREDQKFQIYDPADDEHHHPTVDRQKEQDQSQNQSSYISSATSAISGTAASAKNVVASKLGYGAGNSETNEGQIRNLPDSGHKNDAVDHNLDSPRKQSSYTKQISSAAISAKNAVAAKLGYGGEGDKNSDQTPIHNQADAGDSHQHPHSTADQPIQNQSSSSAKNAVASKLGHTGGDDNKSKSTEQDFNSDNPSSGIHNSAPDSPRNQTSYTDKISSATSALAGTAISAKNAVASKLGYGGESNKPDSVEEQPKKPMGVVTESAEVKKRLGTDGRRDDEDMEVEDSSVSVPATSGVVGKMFKGAVESWFGKGDSGGNDDGGKDHPPAVDHRRPSTEQSVGSTTGTRGFTEPAAGGKGLQDSGNY
ncbi:hypothetical protein LINPERPRIM_LOCUS12824 [Linum perenne]